MATRNQVLQTAASYLGYVERKTRAHPQGNVTIFWDKLKPEFQGSPWCACFVNFCLHAHGIDTLLSEVPLPYFTPSMESWAKKTGRWIMSKDASPGDVLLFTERATVHTGFLEAQKGANGVQTIEGNTSPSNAGSQANGGGVYRRYRARSWVRGAIDMSDFYTARPVLPTGIPALLDVDGAMGPKTVACLQWYLQVTPRDGVMGRMTVRAIQSWVGRERTGRLSPDDVRAIQSKLGATPDGLWGPITTAALQRWINRRITDAMAAEQAER